MFLNQIMTVPTPDSTLGMSTPTLPTRILVVDDAPDVTEMIATFLRYAGHDATPIFSGTAALDLALRERFDIIISDIGMPDMDGYALAARLRQLPDYADIPMVAVTGLAMNDDRTRAYECGFTDFLTKPIQPMELLNLVRHLQSPSTAYFQPQSLLA